MMMLLLLSLMTARDEKENEEKEMVNR